MDARNEVWMDRIWQKGRWRKKKRGRKREGGSPEVLGLTFFLQQEY